jgi:PGF-pre-PGF domain-containing protein
MSEKSLQTRQRREKMVTRSTQSCRRHTGLITGTILLLIMIVMIAPAAAEPISQSRHIFFHVANDDGVKYDLDGAVYGDGNNNTDYIKADGGGLNEIHITADPDSPYGQITVSEDLSGTFYTSYTGGRGYTDEMILLLAVNGTIPDDFAVHIKTSGYVWTPSSSAPTNYTYVVGALDETFTKEGFIYGPQIWKPGPGAIAPIGMPLFQGQDMSDTDNTFNLMFIDLNAGMMGAPLFASLPADQRSLKVEYSFENMRSFATFNIYGWVLGAAQGQGISWTNRVNPAGGSTTGTSGFSVIWVPPVPDFTASPTSGVAPLSVQFYDASTGLVTAWAWDFDNDGVVDSTEQNPSHTYTTQGTYSVELTAANPGGGNSLVKTDYITVSAPSGGGGSSSSASAGAISNLNAGDNTTLTMKNTAISQIEFTASNSIQDILIVAEKHSSLPTGIPSPNQSVYQFIEISLYKATDDDIEAGTIAFSVPVSWLTEQGISTGDIVLLRYVDGAWQELPTTFVEERDGIAYYRAQTPGFSYFAIGAEPGATIMPDDEAEATVTPDVVETQATTVSTVVPTSEETPAKTFSAYVTQATPTPQASPIPVWVALLAIGAVLLLRRRT